jgi:hypothetical protein
MKAFFYLVVPIELEGLARRRVKKALSFLKVGVAQAIKIERKE